MNTAIVHNSLPWCVVIFPGTDKQEIYADFWTYREAVAGIAESGEDSADVMKRLPNGSLTTEY